MPRVVRRQRPPRFDDYTKYKPYLRIDFERRCAYCHLPESRNGGYIGNYAVDHFRPKLAFTGLTCHYPNLFYVCMQCNCTKGASWPAAELRKQGFRFLNPCHEDMSKHWKVDGEGKFLHKTMAGEYTIARIGLNRQWLKDWRREKTDVKARIDDLVITMRQMEEDPDLRSRLQRILERLREDLDEFGDYWV